MISDVCHLSSYLTSEILGELSTKCANDPTGWPSSRVRSFGSRFIGTKPHSSTPKRASIASRNPLLVPTQTIDRRFSLSVRKAG